MRTLYLVSSAQTDAQRKCLAVFYLNFSTLTAITAQKLKKKTLFYHTITRKSVGFVTVLVMAKNEHRCGVSMDR